MCLGVWCGSGNNMINASEQSSVLTLHQLHNVVSVRVRISSVAKMSMPDCKMIGPKFMVHNGLSLCQSIKGNAGPSGSSN